MKKLRRGLHFIFYHIQNT